MEPSIEEWGEMLVGKNVSDASKLLGYRYRIIREGELVTDDYVVDRINLEVKDNTIIRYWVG